MLNARNLRRAVVAAASLAVLGGGISALAHGTETITESISVPAKLTGEVANDSTNNPGPTVTVSGNLAFAGIDAVAIFRNNRKGTHEYEATTTLTGALLPPGHVIPTPKQPVLGGTGGNPLIWVQLLDGGGRAITDEIYLGRCVQALTTFPLARALRGGADGRDRPRPLRAGLEGVAPNAKSDGVQA